jgi:putative chitinase
LVLKEYDEEEFKILLIKYQNFDSDYKFNENTTFKSVNLASSDPCDNEPIPISGSGGNQDNPDYGIPNPGSGGGPGGSGGNETPSQNDYSNCWGYLQIPCCHNIHFAEFSGCKCPEGEKGYTFLLNFCNSKLPPLSIVHSGRTMNFDPCGPDGDVGVLVPIEDDECKTSKDELKKIFPNASDVVLEKLAYVLNNFGKDFGLNSKEKLNHFLSQAGHEVGGFSNGLGVEENLNYSLIGLKKTFKKYFQLNAADTLGTKRDPTSYVNNPSLLANYVYCCRMGNGNELSGDGYKFRGRGIFQLTGKGNYTKFKNWYVSKYGNDKDFVSNPELLKENDTIAILSALWYYKERVIDKVNIDSTTAVKTVTLKINGGYNGLNDRKIRYQKAKDSINCL